MCQDRIARRLALLTVAVNPPKQPETRSTSGGTAARFGPFAPGDIVRISATGRVHYLFGNANVTASQPAQATAAAPAGVPLEAFAREDLTVRDESERYVSIVNASSETGTVYATVFRTGNVLADDCRLGQ